MTHFMCELLLISMAMILGDVCGIVLLGVIIIISGCVVPTFSQSPFGRSPFQPGNPFGNNGMASSKPFPNAPGSGAGPASSNSNNSLPNNSSSAMSDNGSSSDLPFYQKCERIITKELSEMKESSLSKEVKLVGTATTLGGPIHFYPSGHKGNKDTPLFSWKSTQNAYMADDIIVLGVGEKGQKSDFMPLGWMSGAFVALRRKSTSGPSTFMNKVSYYALVAYVRKDSSGNSEVVEWDRFSPRVVRNLFQKETDVEVGESFTIETLMCSYGTCACAACKCDGGSEAKGETNTTGPSMFPTSDKSASVKPQAQTERPQEDEQQQTAEKKEDNEEGESGGESKSSKKSKKSGKKRKFQGVATAIAKSSKGNARSKSEASGSGKHALASSVAGEGVAVAESRSHKGGSRAYSEAKNDSLAESVGGKDGASSTSVSRNGAAQASSQSRGGHVAAEAKSIRSDSEEFNSYEYYNDPESDEDFDGKSLIRDTNKRFAEANARSESMKQQSSEDLCLKEFNFEVNLTLSEFRLVTETASFRNESKNYTRTKEHPNFLYRNPSRYGIDVEVGVNSSVLIATVIPGFVVPRGSCCGLEANSTSIISDFLRTFRQDCNSDLETQVKRLENSFHSSYLKEVIQTKKLSVHQLRDLVPMILLTIHEDKNTKKTIKLLKKNFNDTASEHINKIVAVIVNGAHYAVTEGAMHKVKILKGLVLNVRTVLTGILLEFKRCKKDVSSDDDCSEEYYERLRTEKKLILGLYYFLKFADARYSYFEYRTSKPVEVFVEFMKTHSQSIARLVYCKSRRIILNSA